LKGNAICAKYNAKQRAVSQPKNINELSDALRKLLPIAQQQLDELKKLKPPKEDEDAWKKLLARADQENTFVTKRLLPASDKRDRAKILQLFNDLQTLEQQSNADARKLGLSTCAQEASSS
jgi:hypothetical protein